MVSKDRSVLQPPIAVIGMACRFPGDATTPAAFWELLKNGQDAHSATTDRFNVDTLWHPNSRERLNVLATKGGHFLKQDPYAFDAAFFNISALEAVALDPKQRVALEVTFEAIENAGRLKQVAGSQTACYIGSSMSDYRDAVVRDFGNSPKYHILGTCEEMIANRISHFFDIHGPSATVHTACSSSLVAVHLACQSLRAGESEMALAGGVGMILGPEGSAHLNNLGFLNPDGHCRSFDASPGGYARGEGCGIVMLKLLDKALEDGDNVRAVIRASGANSDGWTQGVTMPSGDAQAALIRHVFEANQLDYADVQYCEAHGTGTKAGDPREATAIHCTIGQERDQSRKLWMGSVKPNIGHLEAAAGVAGVIKGILSLEHGQIPPNIHFSKPNPEIPLDKWHMAIPTKLTPWPQTQGARRMTVSGFGMGGTNGLVVLEESKRVQPRTTEAIEHGKLHGNRLFALSSSDQAGIGRLGERLAAHLKKMGSVARDPSYLANFAHTLAVARSGLSWRASILADSVVTLREALVSFELLESATRAPANSPRIGFVFTGQGAQWARMGVELLQRPAFKASIEKSTTFLREIGALWTPIEELKRDKEQSRLNAPEISQPICTILQLALVDELRSWNVHPSRVAGHSSGEIAAAYSIGALTHRDAVMVAYFRGKVSERLTSMGGGMMAVGCSPDEARQVMADADLVGGEKVTVACVNSPLSITLSGDATALTALRTRFEGLSVFARPLKVEVAYHSSHMEAVREDYLSAIADIEPVSTDMTVEPSAVMISSVTGDEIDPELLGPYYWIRNLVSPVLFADAVASMISPSSDGEGNALDMLIEIGPHSALRAPTEQTLSQHNVKNVGYASVLTRGSDAVDTALQLARELYHAGVPLHLDRINGDASCTLLADLPPYPWNHSKSFRADSRMQRELVAQRYPTTSLIGRQLPTLAEHEFTWRNFIRLNEEPWLRAHAVGSTVLFPGAGMVSVVLQAAQQLVKPGAKPSAFRLRDVSFLSAMSLSEDEATEMVVHARPHLVGTSGSTPSAWWEFTISSCTGTDQLRDNSRGLFAIDYQESQSQHMLDENRQLRAAQISDYHRILSKPHQLHSKTDFYNHMAKASWNYGELFQGVETCRPGDGESTFNVRLVDVGETFSKGQSDRPFLINPASLDAIFQTWLGSTHKDGAFEFDKPFVPTSIGDLEIAADIPADAGVVFPGSCKARRYGFNELSADIVCFEESLSTVFLTVTDFRSAELDMDLETSKELAIDPADITAEVKWHPSFELLQPDEIRRHIGALPVDQRIPELLHLILHSAPASSVVEEIGQAADHANAFVRRLPRGTRPPNRTWLVLSSTIQGDPCESGRHNVLADDGKSVLPNQSITADVLVVSRTGENDRLEHDLLGLSRELGNPATIVAVTSTANVSQFLASDQGWYKISDLAETKCLMIRTLQTHADDAAEREATPTHEVVVMKLRDLDASIESFSTSLSEILGCQYKTSIAVWSGDADADVISAEEVKAKTYVFLVEAQRPVLHQMTRRGFQNLRTLILGCTRILWVTGGNDPRCALVDGLARCITSEVAGVQFQVLHLSELRHGPQLVDKILRSNSKDTEYREADGMLQVARIFKSVDQNESVRFHLEDSIAPAAMSAQHDALRLTIGKPGLLDTLRFISDERALAPLKDHEVEIEVRATGLNFRDIMASMGLIPESWLGQETSGIILRVGREAKTKFKPGDPVIATQFGAHANKIRCHFRLTAKLPASMTFEEAASVPVICNTAVYALTKVAKLTRGQSVLIHAAAGGVGQAAIQLAQYLGLVVYATVGTQDKRELLVDRYGVPEEHIFHSRDTSFVRGIDRVTGGKGVDCVLNSLSGELLRASWTCLRPFGTFVELGLRDITNNMRLDMRPFRKSTSFTFVNLHMLHEEDPEALYEVFEQTFQLLDQGHFRPPYPVKTYPISQVEEAFRTMQQGKHRGKIVLSFLPDAQVPILRRAKASLKLDSQATYLLVGGLGGLGRSLAKHFVACGARNIAFISRSGANTAASQAILNEFRTQGVRVNAYQADIASSESFLDAMSKCAHDLPPVKGVVQMAMVLQDVVFEKMSYDEWVAPLKPKVDGTWNLHRFFDHTRPLDFMIICSSCAGINGYPSQSSYAAGNTFQDALAHHRRSEGLNAISVDLGIMRDVGVLAEVGSTGNLAKWEEVLGIREPAFHALIKSLITQQLRVKDYPAQVCTGLGTADLMATHSLARPDYFNDARFSALAVLNVATDSTDGAADPSASLAARLSRAENTEEARKVVTDALVNKTAEILQVPASEVDPNLPLYRYGVDSLVALEVRNWITREMKANMALLEILAAVPIAVFAAKIVEKSALV